MKNNKIQHFEFLDGLRFICALWVVFSHLRVPPLLSAAGGFGFPGVARNIEMILGVLCNGTVAVMIFFIISGFCIHYPYAAGRPFQLKSFYISRVTRITIPMLIAIGVSFMLPEGYASLSHVLWSLYCELFYYLVYPGLRVMYARFGMGKVLTLSGVAALALSLTPDQNNGFFWTYGVIGSVVLGLPVWIAGCWVAREVAHQRSPQFFRSNWTGPALRLSILFLCLFTVLLHVKTAFKFKTSMLVFAPIFTFWVFYEFNQIKPFWLFKKCAQLGKGCYSIYLSHALVLPLVSCFWIADRGLLSWCVIAATAAALATVFYLLAEKPSHKLAKYLGGRFSKLAPEPRSVDGQPI